MLFAVLIISSTSALLFFSHQRKNIFPERTKNDIAEMSELMESWNKNLGRYPADLKELIGTIPCDKVGIEMLGIENTNSQLWKMEKVF